jgi:hypothetical protein
VDINHALTYTKTWWSYGLMTDRLAYTVYILGFSRYFHFPGFILYFIAYTNIITFNLLHFVAAILFPISLTLMERLPIPVIKRIVFRNLPPGTYRKLWTKCNLQFKKVTNLCLRMLLLWQLTDGCRVEAKYFSFSWTWDSQIYWKRNENET